MTTCRFASTTAPPPCAAPCSPWGIATAATCLDVSEALMAAIAAACWATTAATLAVQG
jgi:hypothetical protein